MEERQQFGRFYYRFPNGESGADVYDRVSTWLESLHRELEYGVAMSADSTVLLVNHSVTYETRLLGLRLVVSSSMKRRMLT